MYLTFPKKLVRCTVCAFYVSVRGSKLDNIFHKMSNFSCVIYHCFIYPNEKNCSSPKLTMTPCHRSKTIAKKTRIILRIASIFTVLARFDYELFSRCAEIMKEHFTDFPT